MLTRARRFSPLLLTLLAPLLSRGQTETAQLVGIVTDQAGRAVPTAVVSVKSENTDFVRKVGVNTRGVYNFTDLLPGGYTVEGSAGGFATVTVTLTVTVGSRVEENIRLRPASAATPEPARRGVAPSQLQTQGQLIRRDEISNLPNLTLNALQFSELAGNLSDAGLGTRGVGVAINGQREASTSVLLDGAANNNEFFGTYGQPVPLESIQEFSVLTSDFTAEFGRASGGIVNVATRRGGSRFHGEVYEFNQTSKLTSNTFAGNANGVHEPAFDRNQFGYAVGGPVPLRRLRNKLFYFSNTEGLLVRSTATELAWVPTSQLIAVTAPGTQAFFQDYGQLRAGAQVLGTVNLNQLTAIYGKSPCTGLACATLPSGLPLFSHVSWSVPGDSGGGSPQNTVDTLQRIDYNLSDRTWIYGRWALYRESDPAGVLSSSPYSNYDLGEHQLDNTFLASVIHQWAPAWLTQSKIEFNRLTIVQQGLTSRGIVPAMYANPLAPVSIGTDSIAFPGYNPFNPGSDGTFGGPQNYLQANQDVTWTRGSHAIRFGGSYDYIQDNRTDAAYQTAQGSLSNESGLGPALNGLLSGEFAQIQVAINPQGKFPCAGGVQTAACTLTLPLSSPNFSRSNRYQEGALYVQDYWKVKRRLSVNLGVRWEHFGVQHNNNAALDSNWYAPGVGFADNNLGAYLRNGGLQVASQSSVGQLWKPDWKDFAPRVGVAWDVFGGGRTTVRGGFGIGYERNFDNVTFNVIQNLPNYAVIDVPGPIGTGNFSSLASTGTLALPQTGARIIDPDLKTAYAEFWNADVQREIRRGIVYTFEYSGSRGVNLYTISYPNQIGFGNLALGDPCTGAGDCTSQPNANYGENVGYRGNQGFSTYYGLNNRVTIANLLRFGISLTANYTWSHAVDNMSSTFFEAGGQGVTGLYGGQNITVNNGAFDTGLLDPYNAKLDKGDAEFDIRHRVTVSGNWAIPAWKHAGWMGAITRGWTLNPLFIGRSGEPFSVFDTSAETLDLSAPRATFTGNVPHRKNTFVRTPTPDVYNIITFLPANIVHEPNLLTPGAPFPSNMSARDSFRAPGFWNLDVGIHKDTRLTERMTLQLRAEVFNIFNHANLYVIGTSADVGASNTVQACFGCTGSPWDRRQVQLAGKLMF